MSAKSNFKAAVERAKRLYKTGMYKTFADAVKAAYKKRGVGAVKRSAKKKTARKKKHHTWGVVHEHKRRVSGVYQKLAGMPNEENKTNTLPAKPKMKISIAWGPGENKKGYLVNEGNHAKLYLINNPTIKKITGKKYTKLDGGFLMASVLKKYGFEANAGGSLFVPIGYVRETGLNNFNGHSWKQIKALQKKY